jgi:signal transduction histidine kinase
MRRTDEQRAPLDQLQRAFEECIGRPLAQHGVRGQPWRRAIAVVDLDDTSPSVLGPMLLAVAGDALAEHAMELAAKQPDELGRLVDEIADAVSLPRALIGRELLCLPQLLQLPPVVAITFELKLLLVLTRLRAVSMWTLWAGGDVRHIAHAGEFDPEGLTTRRSARRVLTADPLLRQPNGVAGLSIKRAQQPPVALIARGPDADVAEQRGLLAAAVPMLTAMLEREELMARGSGTEDALLAATERRLARLRYDLHDGPQQDLVLLAEDLRLFGSQLKSLIDEHPHREQLLGRLEDLQARLVALDGDMRRLSVLVKSPLLAAEPLPDALAQLTDDFALRTGIEPETRLQGDFTELTDSQRIALLSLIRESLSNIREHSDASRVSVTLTATATGVRGTVVDDGQGFDPETTLLRAAREGHLGLVGMHERVRLLGGRTTIDSRSGGPTVISVTLPPAIATGPPMRR